MASNKSTDRESRDRLRRYAARQSVHENRGKRRRRDNLAAIAGFVVVAAIAGVLQVFYFVGGPGTPTPAPSPSPVETPEAGQNTGDVPDPSVAEGREWTGTLTLNDVALDISLDGVAAPQAVASFVTGVADGYYGDKTCHRLVTSETAGLIQCGSLDGTGASDPSYGFGPIENAPADGVYPAGTIAMARVGNDAYSQGRQFFVVYQETSLPADSAGGYTIFGHVTGGLEALVEQIAAAGTVDGAPDGAPAVETTITGLTIQ